MVSEFIPRSVETHNIFLPSFSYLETKKNDFKELDAFLRDHHFSLFINKQALAVVAYKHTTVQTIFSLPCHIIN